MFLLSFVPCCCSSSPPGACEIKTPAASPDGWRSPSTSRSSSSGDGLPRSPSRRPTWRTARGRCSTWGAHRLGARGARTADGHHRHAHRHTAAAPDADADHDRRSCNSWARSSPRSWCSPSPITSSASRRSTSCWPSATASDLSVVDTAPGGKGMMPPHFLAVVDPIVYPGHDLTSVAFQAVGPLLSAVFSSWRPLCSCGRRGRRWASPKPLRARALIRRHSSSTLGFNGVSEPTDDSWFSADREAVVA